MGGPKPQRLRRLTQHRRGGVVDDLPPAAAICYAGRE
jgi:hypothetical protein